MTRSSRSSRRRRRTCRAGPGAQIGLTDEAYALLSDPTIDRSALAGGIVASTTSAPAAKTPKAAERQCRRGRAGTAPGRRERQPAHQASRHRRGRDRRRRRDRGRRLQPERRHRRPADQRLARSRSRRLARRGPGAGRRTDAEDPGRPQGRRLAPVARRPLLPGRRLHDGRRPSSRRSSRSTRRT